MKETNDQELAQLLYQCGASNQRALESLYKKTSSALYGYAFNILGCEALSNEVLQDSFVQIWQKSVNYDAHKGKPTSWIYTIVRNRAIDKLRVERRHLRFGDAEKTTIDAENILGTSQPERDVANFQSMETFNKHFAKLPPNQQLSIRLAYMHGHSRQELAEILDANINTVKSWINRGLGCLEKRCDWALLDY